MKEEAVGEYNSGGKTKRNSPSLLTFLSKYTGWKSHKEEFSFYLRRKTGKNFPWLWHSVRLNGSLVTNVERLCGVFRESVGRWRFRADGDLSPTPLDSLTHAVMTLADAYNLPTECQSLVPLQPKIDPCHAPPPPFIPLIWLLLGPPSPILHRVFCRCFRPLSGSLDCSQNFFRSFILPSTVFFFLATRIEKNVPFRV